MSSCSGIGFGASVGACFGDGGWALGCAPTGGAARADARADGAGGPLGFTLALARLEEAGVTKTRAGAGAAAEGAGASLLSPGAARVELSGARGSSIVGAGLAAVSDVSSGRTGRANPHTSPIASAPTATAIKTTGGRRFAACTAGVPSSRSAGIEALTSGLSG